MNSQDTIFDCLTSIINQTYPNIESIIIDGGSTDKTLAIVNSFSGLSKIVLSEPDLGIYDALNKGMELATGDIIGILHSDDILANSESVSKIAGAFRDNPGYYCLHGDLVYVERFHVEKVVRYWKAGVASKLQFLFGWMPPHPTFYIKREIIKIVGGYRMDIGTASDYEFMLRVLIKFGYKSLYIPEILVKMRKGGISNENIKRRLFANLNDRKAWKVNNLRCYFFTIPLKPIRKLPQYVLAHLLKKKFH